MLLLQRSLPLKDRFHDRIAICYSVSSDIHHRLAVQILTPLFPIGLLRVRSSEADAPEPVVRSSIDELTISGGFETLADLGVFIHGEMEFQSICYFGNLKTLCYRLAMCGFYDKLVQSSSSWRHTLLPDFLVKILNVISNESLFTDIIRAPDSIIGCLCSVIYSAGVVGTGARLTLSPNSRAFSCVTYSPTDIQTSSPSVKGDWYQGARNPVAGSVSFQK